MSFESSYTHFQLNVNLVGIGLVVDSEVFQDPVKTSKNPKVERMEPENYGENQGMIFRFHEVP